MESGHGGILNEKPQNPKLSPPRTLADFSRIGVKSTTESSVESQDAVVLCRNPSGADSRRTLAPGPGCADRLVSGRPGRNSFYLQKSAGIFGAFFENSPWGVGRLSRHSRGNSVFCARLSLVEAPNSLASAQPPHRDLCFHRRDSRNPPSNLGICRGISVRRAVRGIRPRPRAQFPRV